MDGRTDGLNEDGSFARFPPPRRSVLARPSAALQMYTNKGIRPIDFWFVVAVVVVAK